MWSNIYMVSENRGSYVSVLLDVLNKFRKSDKMQDLPAIFFHFCTQLNKLKNMEHVC